MREPEEMDEFEQQLKRAMRRVDARAETVEKFLALAAEADERQRRGERKGFVFVMPKVPAFRIPVFRMWIGGAVAAVLAMGVFVGEQAHERAQERKAIVVQQQFDTAMRVTDHALDQTRAQLERVGLKLSE